jgi:hypothetical protein
MAKRDGIVCAVDPGLNGAVAVWDPYLEEWKVTKLKPGRGKTWDDKCDEVVDQVWQATRSVDRVVVEKPAFHQSVGGIRTARSGGLVKLALLAGRIYEAIAREDKQFVDVAVWKGQLPKDVTHRRTENTLRPLGKMPRGWTKMSDDERDAVAMVVACFREYF